MLYCSALQGGDITKVHHTTLFFECRSSRKALIRNKKKCPEVVLELQSELIIKLLGRQMAFTLKLALFLPAAEELVWFFNSTDTPLVQKPALKAFKNSKCCCCQSKEFRHATLLPDSLAQSGKLTPQKIIANKAEIICRKGSTYSVFYSFFIKNFLK